MYLHDLHDPLGKYFLIVLPKINWFALSLPPPTSEPRLPPSRQLPRTFWHSGYTYNQNTIHILSMHVTYLDKISSRVGIYTGNYVETGRGEKLYFLRTQQPT